MSGTAPLRLPGSVNQITRHHYPLARFECMKCFGHRPVPFALQSHVAGVDKDGSLAVVAYFLVDFAKYENFRHSARLNHLRPPHLSHDSDGRQCFEHRLNGALLTKCWRSSLKPDCIHLTSKSSVPGVPAATRR